jgi:hypothetical protein
MSRILLVFAMFTVGMITLSGTHAATFLFSNANPSGLDGLPGGSVDHSEVTVSFSVGPGQATIDTDAGRLGVDSRLNAGVTDAFPNRLNLLGGAFAGLGESLSFSFNRAGILDKLYFDGMKDETLEYFTLRLSNGSERTIFDFEAEYRLNFQGFGRQDLGVPNFSLADDANDDITGLGIAFAAGQFFTLTYGQIDYAHLLPGYLPKNDAGVATGDVANGARFEGLSVTLVPEPSALALIGLVASLLTWKRMSL